MRYLHDLDPEEIREIEEQERLDEEDNDYWESVAELEAEDKAMEKYYESRYN